MKFQVSPIVIQSSHPLQPSLYQLLLSSPMPGNNVFTMGLYHGILVWKTILLIISSYYVIGTVLSALDNNPTHSFERLRPLKCPAW